ncbi:MAG: hypothetical protein LBM99_03920 [Bacillales bacterium]|jgi:hypothetical protein|nr:hypothetical protein [Bacillales bacterium]
MKIKKIVLCLLGLFALVGCETATSTPTSTSTPTPVSKEVALEKLKDSIKALTEVEEVLVEGSGSLKTTIDEITTEMSVSVTLGMKGTGDSFQFLLKETISQTQMFEGQAYIYELTQIMAYTDGWAYAVEVDTMNGIELSLYATKEELPAADVEAQMKSYRDDEELSVQLDNYLLLLTESDINSATKSGENTTISLNATTFIKRQLITAGELEDAPDFIVDDAKPLLVDVTLKEEKISKVAVDYKAVGIEVDQDYDYENDEIISVIGDIELKGSATIKYSSFVLDFAFLSDYTFEIGGGIEY